MKRCLVFLLILFICIISFTMGCTNIDNQEQEQQGEEQQGEEQQGEEQQSTDAPNLSDYFPLTQGSTWKYMGEGSEYASFTREVLYVEENLAQIKEDNGGTVSASVFKISENEITRIFFEGEEYEETNFLDEESDDNTIILKTPIETGTTWEGPIDIREIVGTDATIDTPAGQFQSCIKVEIKGQNSTIFEYFKDGIGLVKREFISGDYKVISSLETYNINP